MTINKIYANILMLEWLPLLQPLLKGISVIISNHPAKGES
ncbi:hypothetical protein HMPREF1871_00659 [Gemelliphila asaccharolytica]|uniref:Uncharacterized protein n=1 Tax=Gemelliphila asaccharolytica TaxID=502393 RepID=A0ABR5TLS9_9BACL|nr:hypothetical protein HMPREF1871_00659 [Gemella asaccharolytica]